MPITPQSGGTSRQYQPGRPQRNRKRRHVWPIVLLLLLAIAVAVILLVVRGWQTDATNVPSSSKTSAQVRLGGDEPAEPSEQETSVASESTEPSRQEPAATSQPVPMSSVASEATAMDPDNWQLVLVNAANRLEQDYPVKLAPVEGQYQLDERIVADLQAMIAAAKADGYTLQVYSAYRPMERSRILYENKVNEYVAGGYSTEAAKVEAAKWIAPPGTSEHNTGLATDIISGDYFTWFSDLVHDFDTRPEFTWMYEHCAEYGFILRYPKDKQEVTGITYEPWHYRYVGREHAKLIMEQGLCLEEYLSRTE